MTWTLQPSRFDRRAASARTADVRARDYVWRCFTPVAR